MTSPTIAACVHCGTAAEVGGRERFCRLCGHEPFAALELCCCAACWRAFLGELLPVAGEEYPELPPELQEGGAP